MVFISISLSHKNLRKKIFLNLKNITFCHHIQHVTLHKNLVFLAVTSLKCKNYPNFYKLVLLLSGDVSLNPGLIQISPDINSTIREPLK